MKTNIPKNIEDPFYRYKRAIIQIFKGGKGKQTKIVNLEKISNDLGRESNDLIKYFSNKLATNVSKDGTLNGIFTVDILEETLEKYIETYILCKKCRNPETIIHKNLLLCKSCGNDNTTKSPINSNSSIFRTIDNYDKLKEFVLSENHDIKNINEIRDEHRLTPNELTEKISAFLLENLKILIKLKYKWSKYYFNSKKNQKILLNGIFSFADDKEEILKYLKYLYETDYVDEDVILEWYDILPSSTERELKNKLFALPFINWLQTSD